MKLDLAIYVLWNLHSRRRFMPLSLAKTGESRVVKKLNGPEELKNRLLAMGFTVGSDVKVVTELAGNLIVLVKESRLAISREMANRILV
jgi:ferrous iron transport protein A